MKRYTDFQDVHNNKLFTVSRVNGTIMSISLNDLRPVLTHVCYSHNKSYIPI